MTFTALECARMLAVALHAGSTYGDNDFIYHVDSVVSVLNRYGIGASTHEHVLIAAYLHDSVEDTQMKISIIQEFFGPNVADIVYRVTNEIGKNRKERALKTYPKIAPSQDARLLKLADRIANMEHSIKTNNADKLTMYQKEHNMFHYTLYVKGESDVQPEQSMWDRVIELSKASLVPSPRSRAKVSRAQTV